MSKELIHTDCLHFNGYKPCKPHKDYRVHCDGCPYYIKSGKKILIIKLQATGEVMRNTPLLHRLKKEFPNAKIFWLTNYPELVPDREVFKVMKYSHESILQIMDMKFDIVYSLDKDAYACALANMVQAKVKKGFNQDNGVIIPFDEDANEKWKTGIFDDTGKSNKKHYLQEIFEICGFDYQGESYILPDFKVPDVDIDTSKKVVALNTGAGLMWKPRIYSTEGWIKLAKMLKKEGYEVIIVGGPEEKDKNPIIAEKSGAKYFGLFPFKEFIGLISLTDLMVTSVTFGFHVAAALNKKIILLNNTFNKYEFYYIIEKGQGVILEPKVPCLMCYKKDFDAKCVKKNCMDLISPQEIFDNIQNFMKK